MKPGTFGVVDNAGFLGAGIRLSTRSPFSHAFVVVRDGMVVEAEAHGAQLTPLDHYIGGHPRALAFNDEEPLTDVQRDGIVAHAMKLVGTPYGFMDIVGLALHAWTGWYPEPLLDNVQKEKALICSQLVARSYYLGSGVDLGLGRPDAMVTPGDLALRITERLWSRSV